MKGFSVLLVHSPSDSSARYSHYVRELLGIEGFAAIEEIDLSELPNRLQAPVDGIVLPRMALPLDIADAIAAFVQDGGNLITIQPDASLVKRLGLRPQHYNVTNGVISFPESDLLRGLPNDSVQIIIPAAVWTTGAADVNAQAIATLDAGDDPFTHHGVIWHVKSGEGEAVLFSFDLAKSVARLRQGDPDLADMTNEIYDHIHRPADLFRGQLDPRQAAVPQADVLTAVLGRAVERLIPQPRLWYYPDPDQRGVVLQTSDDDWSTIDQFETMLGVLKQYDATATFYVVERSRLTTDHLDRWEEDGHVFSVHPSTIIDIENRPASEESQRIWVPQMVRDNVARHKEQYGRPVNTIRNHAIRWVGYVELARLHAELGIRGEANYFTLGVIPFGFLTGSGRLGRFVDLDGEVIDHYQIASHWTEEILVSDSHGFSERWLYSKARQETNAVIERAVNRFHTPITINSHPVSFATYSQPLIESNWKTARELGAPIISADAWTAWTDQRDGIRLEPTPSGWEISATTSVDRFSLLLPEDAHASGAGMSISTQTIWGATYSVLEVTNLTPGERRVISHAATNGGGAQ